MPAPPLGFGPSRISVDKVAQNPERGRAALIAGLMMLLHSFSERVHADKGYFSLADIFVCSATHDS